MSGTLAAAAAPLLSACRAAQEGAPVLVGIDGRCGSGKTSLAAYLAAELGCAVVHMDDFYLPPAQRAAGWLQHPGANIDFVRLRAEVLGPFLRGEPALYRAWSCRDGAYRPAQALPAAPLLLVEGSYALHPALEVPFALRVFVTCTPACQSARLQAREGAHYAAFTERWIPLEEAYFATCHPDMDCAFVVDTTNLS